MIYLFGSIHLQFIFILSLISNIYVMFYRFNIVLFAKRHLELFDMINLKLQSATIFVFVVY